MKVLIIGGDRRMIYVLDFLKKQGYTVDTLGLISYDSGDIESADIIILPVPLTRDKVNINCALTNAIIPIDILNLAKPQAKIFGGGDLKKENYINYLALDGYAIKNAALTAEGAIAAAMEKTDFSIWQSNILLIGYGRVGKAMTSRLKGFSPNLTVSARSERDFATLSTLGISHIKTGEIEKSQKRFDIVFNTVDIKLSKPATEHLSPTLFIDLSSQGGIYEGVDYNSSIEYIKLPGIPGKCAPYTAGKIIAETVIDKANIKGE